MFDAQCISFRGEAGRRQPVLALVVPTVTWSHVAGGACRSHTGTRGREAGLTAQRHLLESLAFGIQASSLGVGRGLTVWGACPSLRGGRKGQADRPLSQEAAEPWGKWPPRQSWGCFPSGATKPTTFGRGTHAPSSEFVG